MAGVLSKGVRLDFHPTDTSFDIIPTKTAASADNYDWCKKVGTWAIGVFNLQEVPELGQSENANSKEQVDITVLSDSKKQYIDGLEDSSNADSDSISFKFVYDKDVFQALNGQLAVFDSDTEDKDHSFTFRICFPSAGNGGKIYEGDISATFKGFYTLSMDSVSVNSPLTFTMKVSIKDEVKFDKLTASTDELIESAS